MVGPAYGFFGLGLALYFASQGAGRLFWPLFAGFLRMLVGLGGGWMALRVSGALVWLFAAIALGLVLQGMTVVTAIMAGAWGRGRKLTRPRIGGAVHAASRITPPHFPS